jgi:hypothetical protein
LQKRKCQSWDGTKSFLFYSKIGNFRGGIPSHQVTQNREELLASQDYQIIVRQAQLTYAEIIAAALTVCAAFGGGVQPSVKFLMRRDVQAHRLLH